MHSHTGTTISFCDSRRRQSRHASLAAFTYYAIVSRFRWCQSRHASLDAITCYAFVSPFSLMLVETYKLRCMHFLCPSSIYYPTSRSETNLDTYDAIALTVKNLRGTILNLALSCCILPSIYKFDYVKSYVSYWLRVRCRCHAYVPAGGWGGETQSHETLSQILWPYLTLP